MWQDILDSVVREAAAHDRNWQRRRRSLSTLLVVLFVYRLAYSPQPRGYALILADLWECCRRPGVDLPQPRPVAASSMCAARAKVGTRVFRRIHAAVLHHAGPEDRSTLWKGHRAFAVDGSKLHLPRALADEGYRTPSPASHYPQGLLSCLYRIGRRLPVDFDLHAHRNERLAARQHLAALAPGDLVVYDRGYYSFELLHAHVERGMQAVFRLQRNASHCIRDFVTGASRDSILTVEPSETARSQQPQAELRPCRAPGQVHCGGDCLHARDHAAGRGALPGRRPGGPLSRSVERGRTVQGVETIAADRELPRTERADGEAGGVRSLHARGAVAAVRHRVRAGAGGRSGRTATTAWARWRASWKGCSSTMPRCCARRSTGCWRTWPAARSGSGRTAPTRASPSGHPRNGGIASQLTPTSQTDLRLPPGRTKRMRLHP